MGGIYEKNYGGSGQGKQSKVVIKSMDSDVLELRFTYRLKQFTSQVVSGMLFHLPVPLYSHLQNGNYITVPTHKVVMRIY